MQQATALHDQNDAYRTVISDLVSLVEHVQKSLRLIEQTIARETSPETSPGIPESSINVVVLDDVSPRYMKVAAALQACDVSLGISLGIALRCWETFQIVRARRSSRPAMRSAQCIASSAFDEAPDRFLACLPLRKRISISVPLTRTSSHRR
jgi:hypothetical protein